MFVRHQDRAHHAKVVATIEYYVHVQHACPTIGDLVFAVGTRHDMMSGDLQFRDGLVCPSLPGRPYVKMNDDGRHPLFALLVSLLTFTSCHTTRIHVYILQVTQQTRIRGVSLGPVFDYREWDAWHTANVGRKRKARDEPTPTPVLRKMCVVFWCADILTIV